MDKYGVVTHDEMIKTGMKGAAPCPSCGSRSVNRRAITPHCPNCGTRPWEKHRAKKEENRRR